MAVHFLVESGNVVFYSRDDFIYKCSDSGSIAPDACRDSCDVAGDCCYLTVYAGDCGFVDADVSKIALDNGINVALRQVCLLYTSRGKR